MLDHYQMDLPLHPIFVIFENSHVTKNLLTAVILKTHYVQDSAWKANEQEYRAPFESC